MLKVMRLSKPPFPRLVFWYATEKCDLECKHCYYPPSGRKELNTREAKSLISGLADVGVKALAFIGGEPILRDDIFELCSYCVEKSMTAHLITKGRSLTREYCERLSKVGVQVTLGIDTFTHRNADVICGVAELPVIATRALKDCVELGIYKGTVSAILTPNLNEILSTIDMVVRKSSGLGF